ncbi:MAG: hypothetical protein AB1529_02495 [Candidatus Micrarchaeota archaeon]
MAAFDAEALVVNPIIYWAPMVLSLAVFFYAMVFRMGAGNIMRPVFTALVAFAVLSAFSHALHFSELTLDEMTVAIQVSSMLSMLALLIALIRAKRYL